MRLPGGGPLDLALSRSKAHPDAVTETTLRWVEIVRVACMLGLIDEIGLGTDAENRLHARLDRLVKEGVVEQIGETRGPYRFDLTKIPLHDPEPLQASFDEARRKE